MKETTLILFIKAGYFLSKRGETKMKLEKFKAVMVFCVVILGLAGCSTMTTPAINTVDITTTDFSKPMKKATSCQISIFGVLGPFGDISVVEAAKKVGISKIELVGYRNGYYVLFTKKCVIVHGQ